MHPRFARARHAAVNCPGGTVDVVLAERFGLRLKGLMRLEQEEIEPLLLPRCRAIHMHGMKTAIDLVWLECDGKRARVLAVVSHLEPSSAARAPRVAAASRTIAALELPPGRAGALGLIEAAEVALSPGF